jgi:hypothetical protein
VLELLFVKLVQNNHLMYQIEPNMKYLIQ